MRNKKTTQAGLSLILLLILIGFVMTTCTSIFRSPLSTEWQERFSDTKKFETYANESRQSLNNTTIHDYDISTLKLREFGFKNTEWQNVKAQNIDWSFMIIEDSHFENIDFKGAKWQSMTLRNVTLKNVVFDKGSLNDVDRQINWE